MGDSLLILGEVLCIHELWVYTWQSYIGELRKMENGLGDLHRHSLLGRLKKHWKSMELT